MDQEPGRKIARSGRASAVERISADLRAASLDSADGAYLGSEDSLSEKYGVSAPTLRQAARLLEHEQVLKVRRGVSGGYYARRPTLDAIAQVAATYLRGNPSSLAEIMVIMRPLTPVIIEQVIRSKRAGAPTADLEGFADPVDPRRAVDMDDEARFVSLLIAMTGNAPLQLILNIFYDFGTLLPRPRSSDEKALARRIADVRAQLARSLLAEDAEAALSRLLEHQRLIVETIEARLCSADVVERPQRR